MFRMVYIHDVAQNQYGLGIAVLLEISALPPYRPCQGL